MQILSTNNTPMFGIKLQSNKELNREFLNSVKSSSLVRDVEKVYPDAVMNLKELKNKMGLLLEFNLGNGSKFALTGKTLTALNEKLQKSSLTQMESILPASIDYML